MKSLKYIPAMAALLSLAACQSEDVQPSGFLTHPNAVRIAAGVGDLTTRSNPTSDVTAEVTAFNTGDKIKVSTNDGQSAVYKLGTDGNTWEPDDNSNYLVWNNNEHTFTAYYPSTYSGTDAIPSDQSTLEKIAAADYMKFSGKLAKQDQITLSMERQTARVIIKKDFAWKNQYLNGTDPTHSVTSLTFSGKKNNTTITITPYKKPDGDYYFLLNEGLTYLTLNIGVTPNEGGAAETLTVTNFNILVAGTSYTYTLTLGKDVATVGNVTVEDWTSESILGEGIKGQTEKVENEDNGDNGETDLGYSISQDGGKTTYKVTSAAGLQAVKNLINNNTCLLKSNITLMNDIDMTSAPKDANESNWTPIECYEGTFDGNGKTITGLTIKSTSGEQGLIGRLKGGTIMNLTLTNCTVSGGSDVGAFVGNCTPASNSTISGCTLYGTSSISGTGYYVGGIVGTNSETNAIIGCTVSGNVTIKGSIFIGGIAGANYGSVTACLVQRANVSGNISGSIVGAFEGPSITGCYANRCTTGDPATAFNGTENILGEEMGTIIHCYYTTADATPEFNGLTESGTLATDWTGAMSAMNDVISGGWTWSGTADDPILMKN